MYWTDLDISQCNYRHMIKCSCDSLLLEIQLLQVFSYMIVGLQWCLHLVLGYRVHICDCVLLLQLILKFILQICYKMLFDSNGISLTVNNYYRKDLLLFKPDKAFRDWNPVSSTKDWILWWLFAISLNLP